MTRATLDRILAEWQRRLWLERWEIDVEDEPCSAESNAEIIPNGHRQHARLYLSASWKRWTIAEANRTIVHELLHCAHRDVDHVVDDVLDGMLHRDVLTVVQEAYLDAMERFIDDHSRLLVAAFGEVR